VRSRRLRASYAGDLDAMTKAWCLVGLCLQALSDVVWGRVFSSYRGYLNWLPRALGVKKLECHHR